MRTRAVLVAVITTASIVVAFPAHADPACKNVPVGRRMSDAGILFTQSLGLASGKYSLPNSVPRRLVLLFHGHDNDSCAWRNHLRAVARHGAIGVAMDYTGQDPKTDHGWRVEEGAEDALKAAKYFMRRYPTITRVYSFGISMGGNASGLAVASPHAKRANGKPLFDAWIAAEGVHDLIQEYLVGRYVDERFGKEVEQEAGGTFEEVPDRYMHLTNVMRADDMAYLKAAVFVHGVDDGLVPFNQSREMATCLRGDGVPTELFTVLGRGDGESGTTNSGRVGTAVDPRYESPFAGHAWEGSDTALVNRIAFDQLWKVMRGKKVGPYRETIVDGEGLRVPLP